MPPKRGKLEPDEVDRKIAYLLGRGYTARMISTRHGVTMHATYQRLYYLYKMTGTQSQSHLVWWMLDKDYIEYSVQKGERRRKKLPQPKLDVVALIAQGHTKLSAGRQLGLSEGGIMRRLQEAKQSLGCKTLPHLVAVCWTEDWII